MIIAIGADHRGFIYKELLKNNIKRLGDQTITWEDMGAYTAERSDYPIFAQAVCHEIINKRADYGVLICGTGMGMAVVANRFEGIYAALAWNVEVAHLARAHDKANVLVIPSDFVTEAVAQEMIIAWLSAKFLAGRYQERIDLIDNLSTKK